MPVSSSNSSLLNRAKKIRLLAMDVDGVLTGGEIVVLESGEEVKFWNAKDRFVLATIRDVNPGLLIAWITGRSSKNVLWSAKDLGVSHVIQGSKDKLADLRKILDQTGILLSESAYIGDDIIDLPVLRAVGFSACPKDATPDVKKYVHYVSPHEGGKGAVRDVVQYILKAQKKWDLILGPFLS